MWIYKDGIEIERKEFDDNGDIIPNRESMCFVERNKLEKSNLHIFAHTTTKYLNWVVKDMSTGEYVFTSDSNSECKQWIETGDVAVSYTHLTLPTKRIV